jgi:CHAD domain-containing protein
MEALRVGEEVSLDRGTVKTLGKCDACKEEREAKDNEHSLRISIRRARIHLCPFHEGALLEKLIVNFIKRQKRDRTVGFIGPIPKSDA